MRERSAAISTGPSTHLDHLAIITEMMGIPLIIPDFATSELCKEFYPKIDSFYIPYDELTLDYLAENFDVIYECGKFWTVELLPLFEQFYKKKMRLVFCPHGNSDKGHSLNLSEIPLIQDISLVYGSQMKDQLKKTGALKHTRHLVETGNLRYLFYQKHKAHFDQLAEQKVFSHFNSSLPLILYAPTWNTRESPTSFFSSVAALIEELTPSYRLLIKLHPLLEENEPALYHRLIGKYEGLENLLFLTDFPPIYPLLEKTDLYIGDYSSIGYDFLLYDRPLYFITHKEKTLLQQCGMTIEKPENIRKILDETVEKNRSALSEKRKKLYRYAFGENRDGEKVKMEIEKRLYSKE